MSEKLGRRLLGVIQADDLLQHKTMPDEFMGRVCDELESLVILTIPASKKDYYEREDIIFGEEVLNNFHSTFLII